MRGLRLVPVLQEYALKYDRVGTKLLSFDLEQAALTIQEQAETIGRLKRENTRLLSVLRGQP